MTPLRTSWFIVILLAGLSWGSPFVQARDLHQVITERYLSGDIDYHAYLLHRFYMTFAPDRLLTLYPQDRVETSIRCGSVLIWELRQNHDILTPAEQVLVDGILKAAARSPKQNQPVLGAGTFRFHYDITGSARVPADDISGIIGIPDYVETAAQVLDSVLAVYTSTMGYAALPSDGGVAGPEFDIYFENLATTYGYTATGDVTITVDNNFTDFAYYTRGTNALKVTLAHELHHALQYQYAAPNSNFWFYESTSVFMEEFFYPDVNDYYQYFPSFFQRIMTTPFNLDQTPVPFFSYALGLYHLYAHQRFDDPIGNPLLRRMWQRYQTVLPRNGLRAIDEVLQQEDFSFAESLAEFHEWNYFTDQRAASGVGYADAQDYYVRVLATHQRDPNIISTIVPDTVFVLAEDSVTITVPRLAPYFVHFVGRLPETYSIEAQTGDLNDYDLTWDVRVLREHGSLPDRSVRLTPQGQYRAALDLDYLGDAPRFTVQATVIDTDDNQIGGSDDFPLILKVTTGDLPAADADILETPYPSPFISGGAEPATIEYFIAQNSDVDIFILSLTGREVWSSTLGPQTRGTGFVTWNGRNNDGDLVASGVYICMLKTSAGRTLQKMAVIRQ